MFVIIIVTQRPLPGQTYLAGYHDNQFLPQKPFFDIMIVIIMIYHIWWWLRIIIIIVVFTKWLKPNFQPNSCQRAAGHPDGGVSGCVLCFLLLVFIKIFISRCVSTFFFTFFHTPPCLGSHHIQSFRIQLFGLQILGKVEHGSTIIHQGSWVLGRYLWHNQLWMNITYQLGVKSLWSCLLVTQLTWSSCFGTICISDRLQQVSTLTGPNYVESLKGCRPPRGGCLPNHLSSSSPSNP